MSSAWIPSEPLTLEHQLGHLQSARADINSWLVQHAVRLQRDGTLATHVWCDGQHPFAYGFYSLRPHRLRPEVQLASVSGYTGGELSGYLIAKFGIHHDLVSEVRQVTDEDHGSFDLPVPALLLIDALVDMEHAAGTAGGRYAFIDTSNEPQYLLDELVAVGFKPINAAGSPLHFLKLSQSHSSIEGDD